MFPLSDETEQVLGVVLLRSGRIRGPGGVIPSRRFVTGTLLDIARCSTIAEFLQERAFDAIQQMFASRLIAKLYVFLFTCACTRILCGVSIL